MDGIPVSIGIGPSKTLAKLANKLAKKDPAYGGVFDITNHPQLEILLENTAVGDLWGVGRRYAEFLNRRGIANALQLREADDKWIKKHMTVVGLRMVEELRGNPCITNVENPPAKKNILTSRSFGQDIHTREELGQAIAEFTSLCAEKLRKQRSNAALLTVFIETNSFRDEPQYSNAITRGLTEPTDYTPKLLKLARESLDQIFKAGFSYKRAGVMLSEIGPRDSVQLDMLEPNQAKPGEKDIMRAIDGINARLGRNTVKYAGAGVGRPWKMRQLKLSPRFATHFEVSGGQGRLVLG